VTTGADTLPDLQNPCEMQKLWQYRGEDDITVRESVTDMLVIVQQLQLQGAADLGDADEGYTGSSDEPLSCIAQSLMCDELMCASDDDSNCCSR